MTIKTKDGVEIDVSPWVDQIKDNLAKKRRDPFERTPISRTIDRVYFWWDEEKNPALNGRSVSGLLKKLARAGEPNAAH
jgi:hypothetical protein